MVEYKEPPQLESVSLEDKNLESLLRLAQDSEALAAVVNTFNHFERERQTTERRWQINDALYCAWVPPRFWPNTKIERSSLGLGIVFEQVEGAHAMMCQSLFSQPSYFSVEADVGGNPQAARAQQAYLDYALNYPQLGYTSAEMEYKSSFKDMLIYGNGYVKIEFNPTLKIPLIYRVDPKSLYLDPSVPGPLIDKSSCVIERDFLTVEQIRALRSDQRMNIPSDAELRALSQGYSKTNADFVKEAKEALGGNYYSAGSTDNLPMPTQKRIEVLRYYSNSKIIWVLNRRWVVYNDRNPYGFIPFAMAPCYLYTSSPYGLSVADIQEGNQRYAEGLVNARLDNVNLNLFPPRFVPKGSMFTPGMESWGPGSIFQYDEPEKFNAYNPPDTTQSVFQEISFIQGSADRRTGISSMLSGIPTPSNANRSATGVNAQAQGSALRLYGFVDNAENYLLVPSIQKALKMTRLHLGMNDVVPGVVRAEGNPEDTQFVQIAASAFAQSTRVRVRAASKMLSRDRLSQLFQFVTQNLLNGPMISMLQQVGETIDFKEIVQMLMDATGVDRLYKITRPMTQEEQQKMMQAQQAQQQAQNQGEIQKAQMEQQTRLQMGQMKLQGDQAKNQTDLQIAQMKSSGPSPEEIELEKMKGQMDMAKMEMEIRNKEKEAQIKEAMGRVQMMLKQQELQMKQREGQMKLQQGAMETQMNMSAKQDEMRMNQLSSRMNLQQQQENMRMESERSKMNLENEKTAGELKLRNEKNKYKQAREMKKASQGKSKS